MELCHACNREPICYPKIKKCKKCYVKEYNRRYYQRNADKIKQQTTDYYYRNHNKMLEYRKKWREKNYFDNKHQLVLERDNYTCQQCYVQKDESRLIVHHKDRQGRGSKNPNNDLSNLITLCRSCHTKEHYNELIEAKEKKLQRQWSHRYLQCQYCGTTKIKHQARGLCVNCYARWLRRSKGEDIV